MRRRPEYVDLKRAVTLKDAGVRTDPKKIAGAPFLFDEGGAQGKRTSDATASAM